MLLYNYFLHHLSKKLSSLSFFDLIGDTECLFNQVYHTWGLYFFRVKQSIMHRGVFVAKELGKHNCVFDSLWDSCGNYFDFNSMHGSRNFCQGGSGSIWQKKALTTFFFLVLSLFYWSQMVNFKENYHFSRFQRGSNFFQVGGGGSNCLFPIETHIACDFPGGVLIPCPPSGSALEQYNFWVTQTWKLFLHRILTICPFMYHFFFSIKPLHGTYLFVL